MRLSRQTGKLSCLASTGARGVARNERAAWVGFNVGDALCLQLFGCVIAVVILLFDPSGGFVRPGESLHMYGNLKVRWVTI